MRKKFHVAVTIFSMVITLNVFGNDNYEQSFIRIYVGVCALIIAFVNIILMINESDKLTKGHSSIKD